MPNCQKTSTTSQLNLVRELFLLRLNKLTREWTYNFTFQLWPFAINSVCLGPMRLHWEAVNPDSEWPTVVWQHCTTVQDQCLKQQTQSVCSVTARGPCQQFAVADSELKVTSSIDLGCSKLSFVLILFISWSEERQTTKKELLLHLKVQTKLLHGQQFACKFKPKSPS